MSLDDPLLTPAEVAEQLKYTRAWVYELIRRQDIKPITAPRPKNATNGEGEEKKPTTRAIRVRQSEVDKYLAGLGDESPVVQPTPRKRRSRK